MNIYLLCHGVFFYPLLLSLCLQIRYKNVRNLWIAVDKPVGKHHTRSAACVVSIIIDTPAVPYAMVSN